jgi:uncharacterized membrane protein
MSSFFLYLGLIFVVIGILIIMAVAFLGKSGETKTEVGVGGFIGIIPFGFATSKGMLYLVITLSLVMAVVFLLLNR